MLCHFTALNLQKSPLPGTYNYLSIFQIQNLTLKQRIHTYVIVMWTVTCPPPVVRTGTLDLLYLRWFSSAPTDTSWYLPVRHLTLTNRWRTSASSRALLMMVYQVSAFSLNFFVVNVFFVESWKFDAYITRVRIDLRCNQNRCHVGLRFLLYYLLNSIAIQWKVLISWVL